jgi:hypothetical protein
MAIRYIDAQSNPPFRPLLLYLHPITTFIFDEQYQLLFFFIIGSLGSFAYLLPAAFVFSYYYSPTQVVVPIGKDILYLQPTQQIVKMKNTLSVLALAAGISQASATWTNAPSFSCPDNTNNQCTEQQSKGFDWSDLNTGSFSSYGGFSWSGFSCQSGFGKRDGLLGRGYNGKCVTGSSSNSGGKSSSPSFSCDSGKGTDKTSVSSFHIIPEFDCDLEFHYDMPDGSSCKHRASCSSSGTTVPNTQCGGAKNITIVYVRGKFCPHFIP